MSFTSMANEKTMKGNIEEFAVQMKRLVNSKDQSDIKFLIGPNRKPVYGHRCILSNRCAVFRAMFQDQAQRAGVVDKDIPFVLADMTPDIFLAMMEFIYTNCVTLTPKIAIDALGAGLEYGLEELRKLAGAYLIENLAVLNACEFLQASIVYTQEDLKLAAIDYINAHTEDVFKSKGFAELSEDSLVEILRSDGLTMDESKILKYIRDWAQVNSVVMKKPYIEVGKRAVKQIRITLFTPEEIEKIELENRKEPFIPIECFSVAWKFHATKKTDPNNPLMRVRQGTEKREHHSSLSEPSTEHANQPKADTNFTTHTKPKCHIGMKYLFTDGLEAATIDVESLLSHQDKQQIEEEQPKEKEQTIEEEHPEEEEQTIEEEQLIEEQPKGREPQLEEEPIEEEQSKDKEQPIEEEQLKPIEEEQLKPIEEDQPKATEEEQSKEQQKTIEEEQPKEKEQLKPIEEEQSKEQLKTIEEEQPKEESNC